MQNEMYGAARDVCRAPLRPNTVVGVTQEAWHTPRDPDVVNCGQSVNDAFPWLNEFPGQEVGTTLIGYQWRTRPRRRRFFERSWNGAYWPKPDFCPDLTAMPGRASPE